RIWRMRSITVGLIPSGGCLRARERLCSTCSSLGPPELHTHRLGVLGLRPAGMQSHQAAQVGPRCVVFCFHDGTSGLTDSSSCQQSTVPVLFRQGYDVGTQQLSRGWELLQEPSAYLPDEDLPRAKREVMGSEMPSAGN